MRLLICLLLLPATALTEEWVSASDGRFEFEAKFEGEPLPGEFRAFDVSYSEQELTVIVDLTASDMGDDEMNAILHDAAWFGVEQASVARYTAKEVNCDPDGRCEASGELQLKGITQPLELEFLWTEEANAATMQGETVLDRTLFNVGSGEWSSGNSIAIEVTLSFDIQLSNAK